MTIYKQALGECGKEKLMLKVAIPLWERFKPAGFLMTITEWRFWLMTV